MPLDYAFLSSSLRTGAAHGLEFGHGFVSAALLFVAVRATLPRLAFFGLGAMLTQFLSVLLLGLLAWATAEGSRFNDALVLGTEAATRIAGAVLIVIAGFMLRRRCRAPAEWRDFLIAAAVGTAAGSLLCHIMLTPLIFSFAHRQAAQGILSVACFAAGVAAVLVAAGGAGVIIRLLLERAGPRMREFRAIGAPLALLLSGAALALHALVALR